MARTLALSGGQIKSKPPMVFSSPDLNVTKNIWENSDQIDHSSKSGLGPHPAGIGSASGGGGASNRQGNRVVDQDSDSGSKIIPHDGKGKDEIKLSDESFFYKISYNLYG